MGVCCIVFDIDGMLFEFFMNFLNIEKKKCKNNFFQNFMFSSRFMLFRTLQKKLCQHFFSGGGGGECFFRKTLLYYFILRFMLFSTLKKIFFLHFMLFPTFPEKINSGNKKHQFFLEKQ